MNEFTHVLMTSCYRFRGLFLASKTKYRIVLEGSPKRSPL